MQIDVYFSYAGRDGDGLKTGEVSLAETITVAWDGQARRYQASNREAVAATGAGATKEAAIIDYLRARLGQSQEPTKARNSKRFY
jgi:hypothetical protein